MLAASAGLGAAGVYGLSGSSEAATANGYVKAGEIRDGNDATLATLNNGGPFAFQVPVTAPSIDTENVDSDKRAAQFPTIQNAIDGSPVNGRTIIPEGNFSETVTLEKGVVKGSGISTKIEGSGGHTVTTNRDDGGLREIWVDQVDGSGSFDAINISNPEIVIGPQVDVDAAPRYGINIGGTRSKITDVDIQGGQTAGLHIHDQTQGVHIDNVNLWGPPAKGLVVTGPAAGFCNLSATIRQPSGVGAEINGFDHSLDIIVSDPLGSLGAEISAKNCDGHVSVRGAGGDGITISGNKNNLQVSEDATTGLGVNVTGDDNTLFIQSQNTIDIDGNNNTIVAPANATVDTADGAGNSVFQ
jgi:hypothetical protein